MGEGTKNVSNFNRSTRNLVGLLQNLQKQAVNRDDSDSE